jgi:hypothetical protein
MKKIIFLLLLLPISFGLDCSKIYINDIGSASINYSVFGLVDLNFNNLAFENFSFAFRGVPQVYFESYDTNGILSADNFNNTWLYFSKPQIASDFSWHFNASLLISFGNEKIEKNAKFPYTEEFPDEIKKYLEFTKTANEDLRIKILANDLLAGVNDYLSAVAIISEFTAYYIEYDSNYFASYSATATEICDARKGVCDEFSTFEISMLRSVGIPARYVSGYAYTNKGDNGCANFEPHSWIEAYVPSHGWVSIDPTYKEFFWINSAHVPLYKNYDMLNISSLSLHSYNPDFLNSSTHTFEMELINYEKAQSILDINASAPDEIAQDSYLLVNVSISNPSNDWVLDTLTLPVYKTISLINSNPSIPIVIPPLQAVTKYFIFKIPDLECGTSCYSNAAFNFSLGGGKYSSKTVRIDPNVESANTLEELMAIAKEDEKIISPELLVSEIRLNKNKVFEQNPLLSFSIKNIGNSKTDINLSIHYGDIVLNETIESLLINEQRDYEKELVLPAQKGLIDVILMFDFGNNSLSHNSSFIALKEPQYNISINALNEFNYSIILDSQEDSLGGLIKAYVNNNEIKSQEIQKNNIVSFGKKDFSFGENTIRFVLDYSQGENYYFKAMEVSYDYSPSFFERISRFFESIVNIFKILLLS